MKKFLLPLLALCALALPARAQETVAIPRPDPAVAEFARGVKFTVAGYNGGSEVQTNFPVLVRLSTAITGFDYGDFYNASVNPTDPDALKLVDVGFVDAEGNGLAYDIDTWDPSGESLIWVNLPRMTNGTEFAMWYRSSKTGKELNSDNVWADYTGVWHLNESGAAGTAVNDSSTNALHGAAQGKSESVAAGKIGGSWRISDVYDRKAAGIVVDASVATKNAALNALGSTFHVSFWFKTTSTGNSAKWCAIIGRRGSGSDAGWALQLHETWNQLRVYGNGGEKNAFSQIGAMNGLAANTWAKIDAIWYADNNGKGRATTFYNGTQIGDGAFWKNENAVSQINNLNFVIGNFANLTSDRALYGVMDEVRLGKGKRSSARVKADYDTVNTPAFLTAGSVVEVAVVERPIANLQVVDTGASHVQFGNAISSLGSSNATECAFNVKVWKTAESEPAGYTTLATGLPVGALTGRVKGLTPETAYSYKIKVTNDESVDSDEVSGSFTTSGVGVSGTGGDITRVGDDWIHYFRVGTDDESGDTMNTYTFTPPSYATTVRALVVAGGGPGGYYAGGGGGAGGYYYNETLGVTPGTGYDIHVGTGGVASASATVYGSNGGASSIVGGNDVNVVMLGGGAGGNGKQNNQTATLAGQSGGSGGGTAWAGSATGSGTADQGHDGGDVPAGQQQEGLAAGGGGAAAVGGSVEYSSNVQTKGSGVGGNGRSCDITGESLYYAGGGSGGAKLVTNQNGTGTAGAGGSGGGGKGGQYDNTEGSQYATAGADGFGGGGGGGSTYSQDSYQGGDGGDGIVIIRYAAQGDGDGVVNPMISFTDLAYNELSGYATATYRVGWAGDGHADADVYAIWGFDPENLDRTNLVANTMIGMGSDPFELPPLSKKTVYIRLLAKNAGNYTGISPEILSVELYNPRAPEATVSLASAVCTNAVFTVDVTSLGQGAANATVSIQVARDLSFTGDVLSFPNQTTVTAVGAAAASAWGLDTNTTYYARSVVSNDIHQVYETDPIAFETLVPGSPQGTASNGDPGYTTFSALATTTDFGVGSGSMAMRLEVSTAADFATFDSLTPWLDATVGRQETLTATGLVPDTTYHARVCFSNWWGRVTYLPLVDTATRSFPFASSGLAFSAGAGDTVDFSFPVTALYDGATVAATLSYAGTEIGTESANAAPATLSWSGVTAAAETATATVVATATLPGGETIEKTWTVSVAPGSSVSVVANVAAHASAVDALWMRPGEVVLLPPVAGVGFYQVLNPRFATVEGNTLTALEPGIVGIRCVDAYAVTNVMGVVILPDAIGNGSIYVFDETKHGNNNDAKSWSTPACWRKVGSDTNDSFPQNADDIAILPFYSKTYGFIRHTNDITIGGLYAGMIRPNASIDCTLERFKDVPTKTVTFARTDGQPVRIQVCPNGENNCYSRIRLGGYPIDVVWASDATIDCCSSETDWNNGSRGFFDVKDTTDGGKYPGNISTNTLQGVTLTFRGYPGYSIGGNNASGCTAQLYGFWKGTGTLVKEGMGGIVFNNDIGGLSGNIVLKGQKNPGGINAPSAQFSIRSGGATNLAATVYGVVPIGGNGQPTTSNGAGLFGTSAQVQAAPPTTDATTTYNGASAARGPDAPAKGLTLVGGSWYAGRIDNKTWGVDAKDDKEIAFLAVGPGMSYVQLQARSNNTDGYPINVVTAKQLRQTERGTLAVSDPSRYKAPTETPGAMFYAEDWADHATGAEGDCTTSAVHPVIPWIVASVTDGNWGNVAFATFDENGRLVQETRENVQITQATSEDANLYMTSKNLNYGTAGGDYTINSLYLSNGSNNRWLGANRTLRIKSGGLILHGKSAIGLPGRTDNGTLVLGDATHPAYVWAKGYNADTNYLGAAVTAAGGFVSAYPGNLCLVGDQTGIADEIAVNAGTLALGTAEQVCTLAGGVPIRVCAGATLLLPGHNAISRNPLRIDGSCGAFGKVALPGNRPCSSLEVRDMAESTEWTALPKGSYGSSESVAEFIRDDLFSGPGVLNVGTATTTLILIH